jgi:Co/Zn/Cd efflux system component
MNGSQQPQVSRAKPAERHSFLIETSEHHDRPSNEYVLNVAFFSFLGFTIVQTGFAIAANSAAMLEDSEAMFVDALTYLFNLLAERLKHRPYTEKEKRMPADLRHRQRRLTRLYLELIPPFISVSTLLVVTIYALRDSMTVLLGNQPNNQADSPDIMIMMIFSALNLGLDVVNVMCFARVDQAVGIHATIKITGAHHHAHMAYQFQPSETTPLKEITPLKATAQKRTAEIDSETNFSDEASTDSEGLNLNMCSAWTVSFLCSNTGGFALSVSHSLSFWFCL